jgi:hypothetical protein
MSIRSFFRKIKIRLKRFILITVLTFIEVFLLLWHHDWEFTLATAIPLIQLILIFDKKDVWEKMSEEERERVLLSEDDFIGLVRGIIDLANQGEDADSIVEKIKNGN